MLCFIKQKQTFSWLYFFRSFNWDSDHMWPKKRLMIICLSFQVKHFAIFLFFFPLHIEQLKFVLPKLSARKKSRLFFLQKSFFFSRLLLLFCSISLSRFWIFWQGTLEILDRNRLPTIIKSSANNSIYFEASMPKDYYSFHNPPS